MINEFVSEARSWIGTRFVHQGRLKKSCGDRGGCDCIGLIIGAADNVGITVKGRKLSQLDKRDYARVPDGERLLREFREYLKEVAIDDIREGDVLMFRFDKNPQHVGIASEYNGGVGVIHCYMQARGVVEHELDSHWREKLVAVFRF